MLQDGGRLFNVPAVSWSYGELVLEVGIAEASHIDGVRLRTA